MLTALVLICSLGATPNLADCDRDNAIHVMPAPDSFASPVTCFLHGQAYVAGTSIGRTLAPGDRVKVVCVKQRQLVLPSRTGLGGNVNLGVPRENAGNGTGPLAEDLK